MGKSYYISASFPASDMQDNMTLKSPFDKDTMSVYVNGVLLNPETAYHVVSGTDKLKFSVPLEEGDIVSVTGTTDTHKDVVTRNGTGTIKKAIFNRYGSENKLAYNNKYDVNIAINKDFIKWNFKSKKNPFFAKVKDIFSDIGEFIEGYTEDQVSDIIYNNSKAVIELIDDLKEKDIENVSYTTAGGEYASTYRAVKNWVKFKTEIDLIYARYLGISYNYGSIKKEIGDIHVEKSTKLPYLDNLLDRLKGWFEEADKEIKGVNSVAAFVKAGDRFKYDSWARTTLFNE